MLTSAGVPAPGGRCRACMWRGGSQNATGRCGRVCAHVHVRARVHSHARAPETRLDGARACGQQQCRSSAVWGCIRASCARASGRRSRTGVRVRTCVCAGGGGAAHRVRISLNRVTACERMESKGPGWPFWPPQKVWPAISMASDCKKHHAKKLHDVCSRCGLTVGALRDVLDGHLGLVVVCGLSLQN